MLSKKQKEEVWEEILFPLRMETGKINFCYRRHANKITKQWIIKYDFLSKKFTCYAFQCPNRDKVWRRASTNKTEREMLKKKIIRAIRRHLKGMEEAKVESTT